MAEKINRKAVISEPAPEVPESDEELLKRLAKQVNETLKRDSIMVGDQAGGDEGVPDWILTGVPALDFAIGGHCHPGIPGARIIEIFGGESAGKSTLALHIAKKSIEQVQAITYYQDAERVVTPEIIKGAQIDMKRVMRDQPDTLEEAFDSQEVLLEKLKGIDRPVTIILDSIAACSTSAEIDGDMNDVTIGGQARAMSKGLRKLNGDIVTSKVLSIWVNQIRDKVGGISWGDNTSTPGGRALPFYSSVRIKLAKIATLKKTVEPYGCTIEAKIIKNKVAPPLRTAKFDILFVQDKNGSYPRIDLEGALLDWCKEREIIGGSTGRYEVDHRHLYKAQASQFLIENPEYMADLYKKAYSVTFED